MLRPHSQVWSVDGESATNDSDFLGLALFLGLDTMVKHRSSGTGSPSVAGGIPSRPRNTSVISRTGMQQSLFSSFEPGGP